MTNRINQFAAEKAQRLSKAAENVTRVAHTPIDRQATTPYDYELAANEASQLELGSVMSSITQGGGAMWTLPRKVQGKMQKSPYKA